MWPQVTEPQEWAEVKKGPPVAVFWDIKTFHLGGKLLQTGCLQAGETTGYSKREVKYYRVVP